MPNPAKPAELKRLLGNPGRRAIPAPRMHLQAVLKTPAAPGTLDRHGRRAWRRYWALGQPWLSPQTDVEILTRLCEAYDQRDGMKMQIQADGLMVTGSMGQKVAHPLLSALRALEGQITRMEGLCGFTPSDRSRLGLAEVQRVSKLDELITRRNARAAASAE